MAGPEELRNQVVDLCILSPFLQVSLMLVALSRLHGANMEQIISAIDELKGGKDWRILADESKSKALKTTFLKNLN